MPNLVPLACAAPGLRPIRPAAAAAPSPLEVVAALETALADAIARAEPSVVAIARTKAEDSDETTAVRGRNPAPRPGRPAGRGPPAQPRRRRDGLVRLRLGGGDRRRGRDPDGLPRRQGGEAARRPRRRPAGVRGRDHRRRPAERPGRDRAPRGPGRRRRRSSGRSPIGDADAAPQGVVPGRAGQPVQRRARRPAVG